MIGAVPRDGCTLWTWDADHPLHAVEIVSYVRYCALGPQPSMNNVDGQHFFKRFPTVHDENAEQNTSSDYCWTTLGPKTIASQGA